jgi:hypothetical protein
VVLLVRQIVGDVLVDDIQHKDLRDKAADKSGSSGDNKSDCQMRIRHKDSSRRDINLWLISAAGSKMTVVDEHHQMS